MAHHEVVENDVKKELSMTVIGTLTFLVIVLLVAVPAYLRPAGNHVDVAKLNAEVAAKAAASAAAASAPATTSPAADEAGSATATEDQQQPAQPTA